MTNIILGINYGGHDTSAALIINGKLVSACSQERYTLDKHSRLFPREAVNDCLSAANISISDIKKIAFAYDPKILIRNLYLKPAIESDERLDFLFNDLKRLIDAKNIENVIRKNLNYNGEIKYYRHHLCHIASSYYPSGFKNALCFSIDGVGEYESGVIASAKSGKIKILNNENVYPHSFGLLYSAITYYLGWKHHCDEGIIMGLASYGNPCIKIKKKIEGIYETYKSIFKKILIKENNFKYKVNLDYIDYYSVRDKWVTDKFIKLFGPKRNPNGQLTENHKNIAAALQYQLEQVILKQLKLAKKKFKLNKLCLSGGVALNCSLNGKIVESKIFKEIFVQPASGDDGSAYGAALLAYAEEKKNFLPKKMHNFYMGSSFSNYEIEKVLLKLKLKYQRPKNLFKVTSQYLSKGKIVGWFQGKAEFGPRALGNRSILCKPYPKEMKSYLNKMVKFREEFRPFAPSVLNEFRKDYFEINQDSPHMLIACKVKKDKIKDIPATVHVDKTCRVQTVKKKTNPKFYNLIKEFYKITKVPVLLNTSFNIKGQPIVNTPLQAIETFKFSKINVLVIGDFILVKN